MVVKLAGYVLAGAILAQTIPTMQSGNWPQIVVMVSAILGSAWKINRELKKIHKSTAIVGVEHEMLIIDYCRRQEPPIRPEELPTRRHQYAGE